MKITGKYFGLLTFVSAFAALPGAADASIVGQLNISGNLNVNGTGNSAAISFLLVGQPPRPNGSTATFINPGSTGFFQTIAGSNGFGTESPSLTPINAPVNTVVSIPNFLTFDGVPNLTFELTQVIGGVFGAGGCTNPTPAAAQQCSPAGSPFNLTNDSATTSEANFQIFGIFHAPDGSSNPYKGTFTAASINGPFQQLLVNAGNGSGGTTVTYGAQFTSIPEPNVGLLTSSALGGGLLVLGMLRRKRLANRQ